MLLEDFEQRCAYSLVHVQAISESEMHVDHHNPKLKRLSPYENLYPAYGLCNEAKGDTWPRPEDEKLGARFLDPCKEQDYNSQIFEDPKTHELVGTTVAARYHIEMLDLNNPALVHQRQERAVMAAIVNRPGVLKSSSPLDDALAASIGQQVITILKRKIPPIDPPPNGQIPDNT